MHERRRKQDILRETEEGNRKAEKQGKEKKRKKQMDKEMKLGNSTISTISYYDICFISNLICGGFFFFLFLFFLLTIPFKSLLNLPQECKNGSFPRQFHD